MLRMYKTSYALVTPFYRGVNWQYEVLPGTVHGPILLLSTIALHGD